MGGRGTTRLRPRVVVGSTGWTTRGTRAGSTGRLVSTAFPRATDEDEDVDSSVGVGEEEGSRCRRFKTQKGWGSDRERGGSRSCR